MKLYSSICIIIFLNILSTCVSAQEHKEDFELPISELKISNSLYNVVKVLDSRTDSTNMGIIQTGAFNRKAKVLAKRPLSVQFSEALKSMTDQSAQQGELLLQIRQLSFAEVTGATSEKGYFYFRANLYTKKEGRYQQLNVLDTVIFMRSSIDVTRGLLKNGGKIMLGFLSDNISKAPMDSREYSYAEILNIDHIEKSNMKLYTASVLEEGIYTSYDAFMNQKADQQINIEGDILNGGIVKMTDSKGKLKRIQAGDAYAIVHQGKPYVVTKYGFYPLEKREDDYYFTGKAQVTANTASVITASVFFGVIGGLIASDANATFEMKIDHLNGGFIQVRELK